MAKLRGVARLAAIKKPKVEIQFPVRSSTEKSDEQIRLALLAWMEETQRNHEAELERGRIALEKMRARQKAIEDAKAMKKHDHKKVEQRRQQTVRPVRRFIVPPCINLSQRPVKHHASSRIVNGIEQRIH